MTLNLLTETVKFLRRLNKPQHHISWVGSKGGEFAVSWREFQRVARDASYDPGGAALSGTARATGLNLMQEIVNDDIAEGLVIVFEDGSWMEFEAGDAGPGWKYYQTPVRRSKTRKFGSVIGFTGLNQEG